MKTTAHHHLTNAQPVLDQHPPANVPPTSIAEHDITRSGMSLWAVGVSCPGCVPAASPPNSFCTSSLLTGGAE